MKPYWNFIRFVCLIIIAMIHCNGCSIFNNSTVKPVDFSLQPAKVVLSNKKVHTVNGCKAEQVAAFKVLPGKCEVEFYDVQKKEFQFGSFSMTAEAGHHYFVHIYEHNKRQQTKIIDMADSIKMLHDLIFMTDPDTQKRFQEAIQYFYPETQYDYFIRALQSTNPLVQVLELSKAIDENNRFWLYYYHRGRAYRLLQKNNHALSDLKRASLLQDDHANTYWEMGLIYEFEKNKTKAMKCFKHAAELGSDKAILKLFGTAQPGEGDVQSSLK